MKIKIPKPLYQLAKLFGQEAPLFVVGGYVRNQLIHVKDSDIDLASGLDPKDVEKLLQGTKFGYEIKNKSLGTAIISCKKYAFEYSTFRKETYLGFGEHSPSSINFDASIIEDAARRDFTINALYYNILTKEICDFYGGVKDIKNRQIRTIETPEQVLSNDGVRILRMIRLASELNFFIDSATLAAANKYISNLNNISQDYLRKEFLKIIYANSTFYKSTNYNSSLNRNLSFNGIKLMDKLNVWEYLVKKDKDIIANLQGVGAHLNSFVRSTKDDLLLSFCYDSWVYLNQFKKVISVSEFCKCFLGSSGLNLKKVDYQYITQTITNLSKLAEQKTDDKLKLYVVKTFKTFNCAEMRILKCTNLAKYKQVRKLLIESKHLPNDISKLNFDVENFYGLKSDFDKIQTKTLLNAMLNHVILGELKNNKQDTMDFALNYKTKEKNL